MKKLSIVSLLLLSVLLTGCASLNSKLMVINKNSEFTTIDIPVPGEVVTAELGERLLYKVNSHEYDKNSITTHRNVSALLGQLHFPAGEYIETYQSDKEKFYERVIDITPAYGRPTKVPGGFGIKKGSTSNTTDDIWTHNAAHGTTSASNSTTFTKNSKRVIDFTQPYSSQELVYNGRVGNNIRMIYREYKDNRARTPFTQEIQYDLSESKEIGFKGVRIEVIEATNREIKYIVKKSFR